MSERERVVRFLENQARMLEVRGTFGSYGASVIMTMARSIATGDHWQEFKTEHKTMDTFGRES